MAYKPRDFPIVRLCVGLASGPFWYLVFVSKGASRSVDFPAMLVSMLLTTIVFVAAWKRKQVSAGDGS